MSTAPQMTKYDSHRTDHSSLHAKMPESVTGLSQQFQLDDISYHQMEFVLLIEVTDVHLLNLILL